MPEDIVERSDLVRRVGMLVGMRKIRPGSDASSVSRNNRLKRADFTVGCLTPDL